MDQTNFITSRGGRVVWLSKDLRSTPSQFPLPLPALTDGVTSSNPVPVPVPVPIAFQKVLESLSGGAARRPIYVSLNAGAMKYSACPGSASAVSSSVGLSADEMLDMAVIAGADANVSTLLSDVIFLILSYQF